MQNIIIRSAIKSDMTAVHSLIRELAVYENAEDQHTLKVEQLITDGFKLNAFECIVAEVNGFVIGVALYYNTYSTWKGKCMYLEDLVVTQSMRRTGVGSLLFDRLIEIAKSKNVARFEWQVLDWNKSAIDFYKRYSTEFDKEWVNGRIRINS